MNSSSNLSKSPEQDKNELFAAKSQIDWRFATLLLVIMVLVSLSFAVIFSSQIWHYITTENYLGVLALAVIAIIASSLLLLISRLFTSVIKL